LPGAESTATGSASSGAHGGVCSGQRVVQLQAIAGAAAHDHATLEVHARRHCRSIHGGLEPQEEAPRRVLVEPGREGHVECAAPGTQASEHVLDQVPGLAHRRKALHRGGDVDAHAELARAHVEPLVSHAQRDRRGRRCCSDARHRGPEVGAVHAADGPGLQPQARDQPRR
jgi:hypothetical protein